MPPPRPYTLVAELSYQCPLHCPYCSNPVDIGGPRWRTELETEHWTRVFAEARRLGVLQLALTGGEPMLRRDLDELVAAGRDAGLYSTLVTGATLFTSELGRSIGKIEPRDFGRAKRVRVDREATTLLEGGGRAPEIRARIARVAASASSTRALRSPSATALGAPTRITATPLESLPSRSRSRSRS